MQNRHSMIYKKAGYIKDLSFLCILFGYLLFRVAPSLAQMDPEYFIMEQINGQIQEIFKSTPHSRKKGLGHAYKCATPIIRYALKHRDLLWPENHFILYRPTDPRYPESTYYYGNVEIWYYDSPQGHFRIHYTEDSLSRHRVDGSDDIQDTIPPYIQDLAFYLDQVWTKEIDDMGYEPPTSDGSMDGGFDLFDVYVLDIGAYGYTSIANNLAYMVIHNDFIGFSSNYDPEGSQKGNMKVTAAHEFFHAIQYEYNDWSSLWWEEISAVWMEDEVFDYVDDYLRYLPDRLNNLHLSLDYDLANPDYFIYGGVIWAKFLAETYGADFIRDVFERSSEIYLYPAKQATEDILLNYDSDWGEALAQFYIKNLTMDYEEGALYPTIHNNMNALTDLISTDEIEMGYVLQDDLKHLSCHYIKVQADPNTNRNDSVSISISPVGQYPPIVLLAADRTQTDEPPMDSLDFIDPASEMNFVFHQFGESGIYHQAYLILFNPHPTSDQCDYTLLIEFSDLGNVAAIDIPDISGGTGEEITVPIYFQNTPDSVSAFGFEVIYDPNLLAYDSSDPGDCVSAFELFDAFCFEPGIIRIAGLTWSFIPEGEDCTVADLYFTVTGCEGDGIPSIIQINNLHYDISAWLTSPGYFTCDPNYPGPVDTSPPVPDTYALPDIMEECKASLVPPTATDNGLRIITGTTTDPLTYDHQGTYTVTWIYDDGNGNITTQAQNVIVMDTAPPTVQVEAIVNANKGQLKAIATDNCPNGLIYEWQEEGEILGSAPMLERTFERGMHTIELWVSDEAGNNTTKTIVIAISTDSSRQTASNMISPFDLMGLPQTKPWSQMAGPLPTTNILSLMRNDSKLTILPKDIPNIPWNRNGLPSALFSSAKDFFQGFNKRPLPYPFKPKDYSTSSDFRYPSANLSSILHSQKVFDFNPNFSNPSSFYKNIFSFPLPFSADQDGGA